MIPKLQCFLWHAWGCLHAAFPAALVAIEIALIGLFISWRQLRYMQRRDRDLDIRNVWVETHKLMLTFRFRRELLNLPDFHAYPKSAEGAIAVSESLHNLKGQLDRMPDCPLVEEMATFLHTNMQSEQWRSAAFQQQFDQYAQQVADFARPGTPASRSTRKRKQ